MASSQLTDGFEHSIAGERVINRNTITIAQFECFEPSIETLLVSNAEAALARLYVECVVVALYAKGRARSDTSGFVQIKGRDY